MLSLLTYTVRRNVGFDAVPLGDIALADTSEMQVDYGTTFAELSLPSTITVTYSSGLTQSDSVSWEEGSYDGDVPGYYDILGTITSDSNPYLVKAKKRVFVKQDSGINYLTNSSYFYYDFTALTGTDGSSISNGNAGLNDVSVNSHTATIINTPTVNDITVDGNTIKSLEITGNNAVNTGTNANTFLNGSFEVWVLLSVDDGIPAATWSLLGGTQATPEGLHLFIDTSGRLNIFYGTTTSFNWRSTSAVLSDGSNPVVLIRARIDFSSDVVTVWKNGENSSGEFKGLVESTVAGSFSSGNISTVNPALYDCTSNIYIGTNNDAGTPYTNGTSANIVRCSITPLLSNYEAEKVSVKILDLFSELHTSFRFASTIDSPTNLYARTCFEAGTEMPLLVVMAGWDGAPSDFTDITYRRWKDYGYFVLAVGMRGRMSASGSRDANARELHDIYDAIQAVKVVHGDLISDAVPVFAGWSGGGGNGLGLACKYPDLFKGIADAFGISDYGYDATDGWWQQEPARQAGIEASIGGTPAALPNEYRSRNSVEGITNLKSYLWMFHHNVDANVDVSHSRNINDALTSAGITEYLYSETSSTVPLWVHANPNGSEFIIQAEAYWDQEAKSKPNPSIEISGELKILGYLKTSKFTIWLGNGTSAQDGKNRVADLSYNLGTNRFTITPIFETGATDMTVSITTYDGRTATGTISSETTFNPS